MPALWSICALFSIYWHWASHWSFWFYVLAYLNRCIKIDTICTLNNVVIICALNNATKPVLFNQSWFFAYSSGICRGAVPTRHFFFTNSLHEFELTKPFAPGFLLTVLWTKFCTWCKQESSIATAIHWSISATGRREAHPALPGCVLNLNSARTSALVTTRNGHTYIA